MLIEDWVSNEDVYFPEGESLDDYGKFEVITFTKVKSWRGGTMEEGDGEGAGYYMLRQDPAKLSDCIKNGTETICDIPQPAGNLTGCFVKFHFQTS